MSLWVDLREAEAGRMPARCVRTGERCISRTALPVTTLHPVVEWLTWSRLWPLGHDHPRNRVVVSLLPGRIRMATWLRQLRDLTAVVVMLLLVAAVVTDIGFVNRLLMATVVVKVVVAVAGIAWAPFARLDLSGEWVRLTNVRGEAVEQAQKVLTAPESDPEMPAVVTLRPVQSLIARDGG